MSKEISTLLKREDVNIEDTWNLKDLFESDQVWRDKFNEMKDIIFKLETFEGTLGEGPKTLHKCLRFYNELAYEIERLYVYANMKLHQDGANSHYQGLADMSENLVTEFSTISSFIDSEIIEIEEDKLKSFIEEFDELKLYQHYIQNLLDNKDHILDSKMEGVLAQVGEIAQAPEAIFAMFNNADISFPIIEDEDNNKVQITHGRFIAFLESPDPRVRRDAFKGLYSTYEANKNTLAATFSANIKQYGFFAKMRNFSTPIEAALSPRHIPLSVYDNLITTVHDNLTYMHDYVSLRKDLLGLDELHMYDLYTPIVKDIDMKISYDEAWDTIIKALEPMGDEYISLLKEGRYNRWIDIYENKGKRSGAYSWGAYGTHPYVLLNHTNNINSMFTLAHEMGHAIHTHYSNTNQPYVYAGYTIFVAEVASTVNEALLINYLLDNVEDKDERSYLINYFMEQFRGTIYRQTMFAEFERLMHQKQQEGIALTAETISDEYYKLVKKYHGDDLIVDKEISMEWARIPHFYTPFYVYQYATGFSAAIAISQRILEEGNDAVEEYKEFLKGGSSKHPLDLLKIAGVDMSSPEPISKALDVFKGLVEELGKI